MIDEAHITEPMLTGLANRRGEAIVRELTSVGGVPAAQVTLGERRKATDTDDKIVALRLELGVAK